MAEGMNRVILIGNLGQDPELRHTTSGTAVLTLRLATTERYKDRDGEYREATQWHTVEVWGKRGEGLANVLAKGSQLCVEGSIRYDQWEDKQGNKRTTTKINASNIVLLGGRPEGQRGGGGGQRSTRRDDGRGGYGGGDGFPSDNFGDDGIPF